VDKTEDRRRKPWSPEEDERLRQEWKVLGPIKSKVDLFPGRTAPAIWKRGMVDLKLPPRGTLRASHYSWVAQAIDQAIREHGPLSIEELAKVTGASREQIQRQFREQHGLRYHIHAWSRRAAHGKWTRIWALGPGDDAPKPEPQANIAIVLRYQQRQKIKRGAVDPFAGLIQQI
jgi:AraC-like DNA-binding protein